MQWSTKNPIIFTPSGDTVALAIYKTLQEFQEVYTKLNILRRLQAGAQSPADPEPMDLWVNTGDFCLYYFNGTTWSNYLKVGRAGDADKLGGRTYEQVIADGTYTHPTQHAPSIIAQDVNNRFVTDAEKAAWNAKASTSIATASTNGLMSAADKTKMDGLSRLTFSLTPAPGAWTGTEAPFKAELTCAGVLETDIPVITVDYSSITAYADQQTAAAAWGKVYRIQPTAGKVELYATEKPTVNIPLRILVLR